MIPNIITTCRLFLVPAFAYLMLISDNIPLACAVFLISGISDVADGIIARKCNMITETGKIYDPLVDKLMQITVLFALAARSFIPVWVIVIIIAKELAMITVALILYLKKIIVQSKWYGKTATVIFYAVMLILVIFPNMHATFRTVLLSALIFVMLFAALAYIGQLTNYKKALQTPKAF